MKVNTFPEVQTNTTAQPNSIPLRCGCGCEYFQEIQCSKYPAIHYVVLGQKIPKLDAQFLLYRCVACGQLHEPNLANRAPSQEEDNYRKLLDNIEKVNVQII